jgi:lipoyl(octanoyl) transferase
MLESMIAVLNLGRCDYETALRLQESLVELCQHGRIPNVLLFVEHPPVITLGRNARQANVIASPEFLAGHAVEVHEINRGGDVTFHGPGQLVAYPIFDLRSFQPRLGAVSYVRLLEEVLMRICAHYGVETQRICGLTGVWTLPVEPPRLSGREIGRDCVLPQHTGEEGGGAEVHASPYLPTEDKCRPPSNVDCPESPWPERKIAAIGVHIARGVTSHGFALNVTTDLEFFRLIVPCGLARPVTSIEFETGLRPTLDEVMTVASRCFGERFGQQMLWLESIHDLIPNDLADPRPAPFGEVPPAAPAPRDTPARAPENERRIASDDVHLA